MTHWGSKGTKRGGRKAYFYGDILLIEPIFIMSSLYVNGKSDGSKLLKKTEIDQSKLGDYIAIIKEHELIGHCPTTEDNVLTEKGEKACQDIFKNVVIRKRIELKKEIQSVERICSQVQ